METFEQFKSVPNVEKLTSGVPLDEQREAMRLRLENNVRSNDADVATQN